MSGLRLQPPGGNETPDEDPNEEPNEKPNETPNEKPDPRSHLGVNAGANTKVAKRYCTKMEAEMDEITMRFPNLRFLCFYKEYNVKIVSLHEPGSQ